MNGLKKTLACILLGIAAAFTPLCTQASVLTWSIHNLTFEVPDGGTVTYNSATHFEIMWPDMALVIDIYGKEGAEEDALKSNLVRRANGYNMYETQFGKLKVKGFKCHTLTGTMPDGSHTLLANLVCNNKDLLVSATVNYMLGNIEDAEDIVKSFTIGKQKIKKEKKQKIQSEEDAIAKEKEQQKKNKEKEKKENATKAKEHYEIFDC